MLRPRRVAVIGASRTPNTIGHEIVSNLVGYGFTGTVFPVNPKADAICTLKTYPSIGAVPDPVDMAVITVPKQHVLTVAEECQVLAALSYDGTAPGQLKGSMQRVTAGASTTSQTLQQLGIFDAPGSGGWGLNNLVPLKDGSGNDVLVSLSGSATVRFTAESGDIDYYVFRLIAAPQIALEPSDVTVVEGGTASFTVVVSNPAGCTYQWYRGANLINGATASTYTLSPALAGDSGATFRCRITNPQGVVDSRTAVLTYCTQFSAVKRIDRPVKPRFDPAIASAHAQPSRFSALPPLARLGLKSDPAWRVDGLPNAWSGLALTEPGGQIFASF